MPKLVTGKEGVSYWLIRSGNVIITVHGGKYKAHPTILLIALSERKRDNTEADRAIDRQIEKSGEDCVAPGRNHPLYECLTCIVAQSYGQILY